MTMMDNDIRLLDEVTIAYTSVDIDTVLEPVSAYIHCKSETISTITDIFLLSSYTQKPLHTVAILAKGIHTTKRRKGILFGRWRSATHGSTKSTIAR
jgi:hypothetical protein